MIKFFRKIRQNLLSEGRTRKYLKYAAGEIILVVIGILIALQINNWNQERIDNNREFELLQNLKEELDLNISTLNEIDSVFDEKVKECNQGMELLKEPLNITKFLEVNSLITTRWAVFRVNRNTYDEMLNSGSFYSLKNKMIQEAIRTHYTMANNFQISFQEINKDGQNLSHNNKELFVIEIIEDWSNNENNKIKSIDTSWFDNPNSPTYQAYYKKAKYFTNTNALKKSMIERFIESCKNLSDLIEIEL